MTKAELLAKLEHFPDNTPLMITDNGSAIREPDNFAVYGAIKKNVTYAIIVFG